MNPSDSYQREFSSTMSPGMGDAAAYESPYGAAQVPYDGYDPGYSNNDGQIVGYPAVHESSQDGLQSSVPAMAPNVDFTVSLTTASFDPLQSDPSVRKRGKQNRGPVSSEGYKRKAEFGLIALTVKESDLRVVRKFYDIIPLEVYNKHIPGTAHLVRITELEHKNLAIHLERQGNPVKVPQRKKDFMDAIPVASARYEGTMAKKIARKTGRKVEDVLADIRAHTV